MGAGLGAESGQARAILGQFRQLVLLVDFDDPLHAAAGRLRIVAGLVKRRLVIERRGDAHLIVRLGVKGIGHFGVTQGGVDLSRRPLHRGEPQGRRRDQPGIAAFLGEPNRLFRVRPRCG